MCFHENSWHQPASIITAATISHSKVTRKKENKMMLVDGRSRRVNKSAVDGGSALVRTVSRSCTAPCLLHWSGVLGLGWGGDVGYVIWLKRGRRRTEPDWTGAETTREGHVRPTPLALHHPWTPSPASVLARHHARLLLLAVPYAWTALESL
jgi:hypothetical protein